MNGQWPPQPGQPQASQMQQGPPLGGMGGGGGIGGEGGAAGGGANITNEMLPSSEALEVEAMRRGMPPLEQCLRRCPRCLQGVPIRSMMCQHCQYLIPVSAKAIARREMKEAAQQQHGSGHTMMNNGGGGFPNQVNQADGGGSGYGGGYPVTATPQAGGALQGPGPGAAAVAETGAGGGGGGSDSDERKPRVKRKRQSTKKGLTTATEEELKELDEGMSSEEEPVSWRKSSTNRGRSGVCLCCGGRGCWCNLLLLVVCFLAPRRWPVKPEG